RDHLGRAPISTGTPSEGVGVVDASDTARATDGVEPSCTCGVVDASAALGEAKACDGLVVIGNLSGRGSSWPSSGKSPPSSVTTKGGAVGSVSANVISLKR